LPGYVDRGESSLVSMVNYFIIKTEKSGSVFYPWKRKCNKRYFTSKYQNNIQTVLFGVSFALLDVLEKNTIADKNLMIIETGGMKGLREDLTKEELLTQLKKVLEQTGFILNSA
jgi:hypothetical protein